MRVTVGEISKMVMEAVQSTPPKITGAEHKAAMRSLARAERDMNARATAEPLGSVAGAGRNAARGTKPAKTASELMAAGHTIGANEWNSSDDRRLKSLIAKVSRNVSEAISEMLSDSWDNMSLLSKAELRTAGKMTTPEFVEALQASPIFQKALDSIGDFVTSADEYMGG